MSYQRWGKPGRWYVYSTGRDLIVHEDPQNPSIPNRVEGGPSFAFTGDVAGRDNAKAVLRGLVEHLHQAGVDVVVKKGRIEFVEPVP